MCVRVLLLASGVWHGFARLGADLTLNELSDKNFDDFMLQNDKVMIDFYKDSDSSELEKALATLRSKRNRAVLARVDASKYPELTKRFIPDVCNEESQTCRARFPQLLWFVKGKPTTYHRSFWEAGPIASFVMALDREVMTTIKSEAKFIANIGRVLLFRGEKQSKMYEVLDQIAGKHMDTLAVAHIEEAGSNNISWISMRQLVDNYSGEADEEDVETWVRHHLVWSEEAPEKSANEDGTLVVVGSTFDEVVLRDDSDVFLMVYAPWCGFSRKASKVWSQLAMDVAGMEGLAIAKMDGEKNVVSTRAFFFNTYPTFAYIKAGEKTPILFQGNRTLEAFKAFAQSTSDFPLDFAGPRGNSSVMLLQDSAAYYKALSDLSDDESDL